MPKLPLFVIHIIVIRSTAVFQVKPIITLHKCDILLEVIWKIALDFLFHRYVANCFPHHGYIWNYGAIPQVRVDPAPHAWGFSNPFYGNVISSLQYKAAQCLTFVIDRHGKTPTTRTHYAMNSGAPWHRFQLGETCGEDPNHTDTPCH